MALGAANAVTVVPATLLGHLGMKQNGDDTARYGITSNASPVVEKVATAQLNRDGVAAIWLLHLSATQAHVDGYANAAKLMLRSRIVLSGSGWRGAARCLRQTREWPHHSPCIIRGT
jgi:hypothetical protein